MYYLHNITIITFIKSANSKVDYVQYTPNTYGKSGIIRIKEYKC